MRLRRGTPRRDGTPFELRIEAVGSGCRVHPDADAGRVRRKPRDGAGLHPDATLRGNVGRHPAPGGMEVARFPQLHPIMENP